MNLSTVFPRIIAGGDYSFFRTKRGSLFEGGDYFKFGSLINFQCQYPRRQSLNRHWWVFSVACVQAPHLGDIVKSRRAKGNAAPRTFLVVDLTGRGQKKKRGEDGERGWGRLFEDDYSRKYGKSPIRLVIHWYVFLVKEFFIVFSLLSNS